jgi:hypothetical protein
VMATLAPSAARRFAIAICYPPFRFGESEEAQRCFRSFPRTPFLTNYEVTAAAGPI